MIDVLRRITASGWFQHGITAVIIANGVVIGLDTSAALRETYAGLFAALNQLFLAIFVVEAVIKIAAEHPHPSRYFKDGWNLFDFTVLVLALIPDTGEFALIARLARLLRVLRLITVVPQLRLIVSTLVRSLPGLGHVMLLLFVIYYVYAVAGVHLFREHDPVHWESLGIALLTLFRVMTLEDWTDVMYTAMELHPMSWIFFVSFVLVAAVVMINMVIAVVINNLHEARLEVAYTEGEETLRAIREEAAGARDALERIEARVASLRDRP